jgi:hypothetical protein
VRKQIVRLIRLVIDDFRVGAKLITGLRGRWRVESRRFQNTGFLQSRTINLVEESSIDHGYQTQLQQVLKPRELLLLLVFVCAADLETQILDLSSCPWRWTLIDGTEVFLWGANFIVEREVGGSESDRAPIPISAFSPHFRLGLRIRPISSDTVS